MAEEEQYLKEFTKPAEELTETDLFNKRFVEAADHLYIARPRVDTFQEFEQGIVNLNNLIEKYENELLPQIQKVKNPIISDHFLQSLVDADSFLQILLAEAMIPLETLDRLDEEDLKSLRNLHDYVSNRIIPRARAETINTLAENTRALLDKIELALALEEGSPEVKE
ncbi:MAG TPA: hypothetical protein VFA52_00575 [Candidatus Paceibacterota bacterium]|nr:hypothetical protein [Candidatus Paceibacterota bacterium]